MTDWLIASKPANFKLDSLFADRTVIDWSETFNAHLHAGDRVFLYQAAPVQAITHVCEVIRTAIDFQDTLDDDEFLTDNTELENRLEGTWMRLSLLYAVPEDCRVSLALDRLREAGLKAAPQGRMRAPAEVTALVSDVVEQAMPEPLELILREQALIADLGIERPPWQFQRGRRGGTRSLASFNYALSMPDAPTALAMLRAYVRAVGLNETDRWSVSAMPSWAGATDQQRFATVSGAGIELFYVWFESSTGAVTEWGARIPAELAASQPPGDALWQSTADNGDIGVHGETLAVLLNALDDAAFLAALRATSDERQGARRSDWHNPYLGALLAASTVPLERDLDREPATEEDVEFERRYIERVTKRRLHQAPLREASLRRYGARCMYCGLDVPQVLEAAHVIPDSEGGAASTSNIRILCANHHAALDAELLMIEGDGLIRAPGAPEVAPAPEGQSRGYGSSRGISIAIPVRPDKDEDEDEDLEDEDDQDERFTWCVTEPYNLTPNRLGDQVLYDQADDSDLYVEGDLLGIHFLSEDPSHPRDVTYRLDIRPKDASGSTTITVRGDGYVSRYIDTEDPEAW